LQGVEGVDRAVINRSLATDSTEGGSAFISKRRQDSDKRRVGKHMAYYAELDSLLNRLAPAQKNPNRRDLNLSLRRVPNTFTVLHARGKLPEEGTKPLSNDHGRVLHCDERYS